MAATGRRARAATLLLPATLVISGLTFLAAFIASSIELDYMRILNSMLCLPPPSAGTINRPSAVGCHPYLLVPWAMAIPAGVLSLLFVGVIFFAVHRRPHPGLRRWLILVPALLLAGLWLAVLCVGWVSPRGPDTSGGETSYYVPVPRSGWFIDVFGGPDVPLTGGFDWALDFYEDVFKARTFKNNTDPLIAAIDKWKPTARAGMAGVVLCSMSFAWAAIVPVVLISYKVLSPPMPMHSDGPAIDKALEEATHAEGDIVAKKEGPVEIPERKDAPNELPEQRGPPLEVPEHKDSPVELPAYGAAVVESQSKNRTTPAS